MKDLKNKNFLSDDAAGVIFASLSESSKAIFNRQLNKKGSKKEFPQVLRTFATTLQFYSSRAYNYVRKTFMNSLPHPETIRKWYQKCDGTPGITKESIDTLKIKIDEAKSMNKILYFNLTIDEMCIKRKLDWDGKKYTGFVDLGTNVDTDELPEAQYALVFLVTCLNAHYKIPVAYYFIHSLTGEERANLLKQCLTVLYEANINITSVTVDGAASNIAMFNKMGANLTVQNLVPYFDHPVTKDKIYILLDACHMLKLVRNAFASTKIMWHKDNRIIRWNYIKSLIDLQETERLHAETKVRRRHLN